MPSYRELLRDAKSRITEISPEEAEARLGSATFLDVREQDEHDQGTIPGSVFIPRGHLESQAETRLLDRDQPIVVYCAAGNRSAFAAETLEQLGFTVLKSLRRTLETEALLTIDRPANYRDDRFNYLSAPLCAAVPLTVTYELRGATFEETASSETFEFYPTATFDLTGYRP